MASSSLVGFFGKLPGAGDFVQRRLPPAFVESWDRHFERAVEAGRSQLGERWPAAYRSGPVWRFLLPAQACGDGAWAGVVGPAEDRVGRGFPMLLAAPFAGDTGSALSILRKHGWFDALERAQRAAQADPTLGVEAFDARVAALPGPLAAEAAGLPHDLDWNAGQWRLALPAADASLLAEAWQQLSARPGAWCLWWTDGAGQLPPSLLATRGLPASYAAFLDETDELQGESFSHREKVPEGRMRVRDDLDITLRPHPHPPAGTLSQRERDAIADVDETVEPMRIGEDLDITQQAMSALPVGTISAWNKDSIGEAVLSLDHGRLFLVSADEGSDPRSRAAGAIRAAAQASAPDLASLQANLLALHPRLRLAGEDLIDPVAEEGAVVVAQFGGRQVRLLRIGSAAAWHWRRGQLKPLFVEHAASGGGEFDDLLFGAAWLAMPGLGAAEQPHCDEAAAELEAGDRLLLLAGRALTQLSRELFADALGLPTCEDARARIAGSGRLGPHPAQWPLAVTEIES